jgi:hypothetical protein
MIHTPEHIDHATVTALLECMYQGRSWMVLQRLQNVAGTLVYDLYPREEAILWMFGASSKPLPTKLDTRFFCGFFWAVLRALCATLPIVPRRPDGDRVLSIQDELIAELRPLPFPIAIDTWMYTCGVWLTTCAIDEFVQHAGPWGVQQIAETGAALAMINWEDSANF